MWRETSLLRCALLTLLSMALHLREYAEDAVGAEQWVAEKMLHVSPGRVLSDLSKNIDWVRDYLFGSPLALYGLAGIALLLLAIRIRGQKRPARGAEAGEGAGFVWVIAAVCAVYIAFALVAGLGARRYFMSVAPMLAVLFWKALHELSGDMAIRGEALAVCAVLAVAGVVCQQCLRPNKIEYAYPQDRPAIQAVQDSGIEDAIVIYTDDSTWGFSVYDCVNLLPDDARLYPVDLNRHHIDAAKCPDEVLVWSYRGRTPDEYVSDLLEAGYELTMLGRTHISEIYLASKAG